MKKVLFVATVVKTHIMEFHIPYLKMLKDMGWKTAVAARNDYENPADCVIPYCDAYFDIPFERSPVRTDNIKAYRKLKKVIENGKYDIVHCHTPVGAMLARLAARKARKNGTKVIYTAHGFHFFKGAPLKNWLLYYPAEWLLAHWTDVLITINREDFRRAKKFHARKVMYVPGVGIDLTRFCVDGSVREEKRRELDIPKDAFVLLSVGELIPRKNQGMLIRALAELHSPDIYCVVCGRGPLMEEYRRLAKELKVEEQVMFLGYREDIPDMMRMADLFVFLSLHEGLPVAVMEAMASGLPAVCSRIRGSTDLIENGKNGIFAENNPNAVALAIKKLRNEKLRKELAYRAAETVKKYELTKVLEQVKKIYLSL